MVQPRRLFISICCALVLQVAANQQGLRSRAVSEQTQQEEGVIENIFNGMSSAVRYFISDDSDENPPKTKPKTASFSENSQGADQSAKHSSGGQVFSITLNSELQEREAVVSRRPVNHHSI
eukprot:CAMPEP_0197657368 /NCGR_PEP_ID=MMETSP1338-20131121/44583_1 /TAXON_ID=43686 ORGANISM="Pelagodinium beii, Strain RCC1491" /NCGR_SAMPLE_ID=MMETSP1338 /ASSEMBLY_ACC=CAM_ASM_000754 /LENGTH=120 /DNA_ID=CAMNT_0043233715 /DNA_START=73 /DNA_END=435 /DNA_ORIENTATION=+